MDRVHRLFNTKIIRLIKGNSSFTNNPLPFSIINPQSTHSQEAPQISKIIPIIPLATSKNYK
jgi:hypothetical protein